ncbi:DUF6881 domain-containing protein [Agrobacterium vitis]|uniref:DUF6881 domain-containing protein n=1 Tax=Agrobacterium vitis TaxID=373 RepID=A0A7K1RFV0_AGRVI|nr:hypothetical protein [Agrobacterium vitis]MVA56882.1 hypothetical protein [Agrobacterium vitis]
MNYVKSKWHHENPQDPVEILMELDDRNMEVRKIHLYIDGHAEFADANTERPDTWLSYEPVPAIDEINSDPQFQAVMITKDEFEKKWRDVVEA